MGQAIAAVSDRAAGTGSELRLAYQRLDQCYRQLDQDLEAACRVQRCLQTGRPADVPPVHFGLYTRSCGRSGGDDCAAFAVDANHVGFYLATVVGRGVSAALLKICLRLMPVRRDASPAAQALPPDQVLQRFNRLLLDMSVPDAPFVTMVYGLIDRRDGTLTFSRAGHAYPILLPHTGPAKTLAGAGNLLGVFPTHFSVEQCRLEAGARFLLYSDGLAPRVESAAGADRLLVALLEHRALPIQEQVEQTALALLAQTSPTDDATLLAVEYW